MATYTEIVTAIDTAIASGVSGPGSIESGDMKITYRDLTELLALRKYYWNLKTQEANASSSKLGIRFLKAVPPGSS
jgi:hypothetical protein